MDRLGIYVIYDQENIIDDYIGIMLEHLKEHLTKLVVVCNFKKIKKGYENIKIADSVIFRENKGYDAGAFKDELCKLFDSKNDNYDEILITNDSFFGPIDSFDKVFSEMKKNNCDYWGLTKFPEGIIEDRKILPHIQSYFLCFRKRVICSNIFRDFWYNMSYPNTYLEAIFGFELEINRILEDAGFSGVSYQEVKKKDFDIGFGKNPYMKYSLELIKDIEVPIIKRKAFDFNNYGFKNAIKALDYIEKNKKYDVNNIKKHIIRKSIQMGNAPHINLYNLQKFYNKHTQIYIYGAGVWGLNLGYYFKYKSWSFNGYLVSNDENNKKAKIYSECEIDDDAGIIIAVGGKENIEEIYDIVLKNHSSEHIFKPVYL